MAERRRTAPDWYEPLSRAGLQLGDWCGPVVRTFDGVLWRGTRLHTTQETLTGRGWTPERVVWSEAPRAFGDRIWGAQGWLPDLERPEGRDWAARELARRNGDSVYRHLGRYGGPAPQLGSAYALARDLEATAPGGPSG